MLVLRDKCLYSAITQKYIATKSFSFILLHPWFRVQTENCRAVYKIATCTLWILYGYIYVLKNIFFDVFLCSKVGWKWHFLEILSMKNLILMVYWNKKNVAAAFEQRVIEMRQTKSIVLGIEAVGIKHNRTNCHNRLFWKKCSDKDYKQLF